MRKVKTSELIGPALDWAVAKCEGESYNDGKYDYATDGSGVIWTAGLSPFIKNYSTDWLQGGPIIEREGINIVRGNDLYFPKGNEKGDYYEQYWIARIPCSDLTPAVKECGITPLIAAMRAFVVSKLGNEIEVPEELVEGETA